MTYTPEGPAVPVKLSTSEFFHALFGDAEGWLMLSRFDPKTEIASFRYPSQLPEALAAIPRMSSESCVFFNVGLQGEKPIYPSRGAVENVSILPGLHLDLDIAGPTHKETKLPPDKLSAKTLLEGFPSPSITVKTGGGYHLYWLTPASRVDTKRVSALCQRFQNQIISMAKTKKWKCDDTASAIQCLRPPETFNRKPMLETPFAVAATDTGLRYTLDELEEKIKALEQGAAAIAAAEQQDAAVFVSVSKFCKELFARPPGDWSGKSTFDDYRERGPIRGLLESHGWAYWKTGTHGDWFSRPGKTSGVSGTLFTDGGFYCFTSGGDPLKQKQAYSPAQLYAAFKHGGDLSAAAKDLYAQGYGDRQTGKVHEDTVVPAEDPEEVVPVYIRPSWADVMGAIEGSPLKKYMEVMGLMSKTVPAEFGLGEAIVMAAVALTTSRVRIGYSPDDISPLECNCYLLKFVGPSSGKGISSMLRKSVMAGLGLKTLSGNSDAAIVAHADKNESQFGLFYENEILHVIDSTNAAARLVMSCLLKVYDEGVLKHETNPKGNYKCLNVSPAAPSVIIEGQPAVFESFAGKQTLNSGFMPRFIQIFPHGLEGRNYHERIRKNSSPPASALTELIEAYRVYMTQPIVVVLPPEVPESQRVEAFWPSLNEGQRAAWGRLEGMYLPRIAVMLEPESAKSGRLSEAAMARAMIVVEWLFGEALRTFALCHDSREEAIRAGILRFITRYPAGCTRCEIMHGTPKGYSLRDFQYDFAPTLLARGDIRHDGKTNKPWEEVRARYFPVRKLATELPTHEEPNPPVKPNKQKRLQPSVSRVVGEGVFNNINPTLTTSVPIPSNPLSGLTLTSGQPSKGGPFKPRTPEEWEVHEKTFKANIPAFVKSIEVANPEVKPLSDTPIADPRSAWLADPDAF